MTPSININAHMIYKHTSYNSSDNDQTLMNIYEQIFDKFVYYTTGPKRSTLQAMLANLGGDDDMPAYSQAGAASSVPGMSSVGSSSSSSSSGNEMPEIDDMGMHVILIHIRLLT